MGKTLHFYLGILLISLVGNSCADFAILWLAADLVNNASFSGKDLMIAFYCGQAVGFIFLAPVLSSKVDRINKFKASVLIDGGQIFLYATLLLLFKYELLNFVVIILYSILMASLSSLHRNAITFSVLGKISEYIQIDIITKKFFYVFNFTLLFGIVASSICFEYLGFDGCLYFAIFTFLPMFFIYFKLFDKSGKPEISKSKFQLFGAYKKLISNLAVLHSAIAVSIAYVPGAIYPGIVTLFMAENPDLREYIPEFLSLGIVIGTIFIPIANKVSQYLPYSWAMLLGFSPAVVSVLIYLYNSNPTFIGISFALNCIGFSFSNVFTLQLRLKTIGKDEVGAINTSYYGVMCVGQIIGSLIVLPQIKVNPSIAANIIVISFIIASGYFFYMTPKKIVNDI